MKKNTEIELKARIDEPNQCRARLTAIAGEGTAFSKDDAYWFAPLPLRHSIKLSSTGIRVRQEKIGNAIRNQQIGHNLVTWKNKERQDCIEVNTENEFELKDTETFERLLALLGLEKTITKRKQGWAWRYRGISAELSEVSGFVQQGHSLNEAEKPCCRNLGWFLELEILAEEGGAETVTAAREQLLELLEKTGVRKENIESRYYTELLEERPV